MGEDTIAASANNGSITERELVVGLVAIWAYLHFSSPK